MIEIINKGASARRTRVALFDFDGTLSTIRSGWMEIMIPMMVEILMDLKTGEREEIQGKRHVSRSRLASRCSPDPGTAIVKEGITILRAGNRPPH